MEYKVKNYKVRNKVSEHRFKNISEDKSNNTDEKTNIVYGLITAKEVARYVPVTQNVIER